VEDVIAFVGVVALIVVVPGPDMALVMQNGLTRGRSAAVRTAVGINVGLLVWAGAAALGLAALVNASATGFTLLKLAGAAYLVWLGLRTLVSAWRGTSTSSMDPRARRRAASPFRQGMLSNLLNPKIAIVFTSLIPQFVDAGDAAVQTLAFAAIFIVMGVIWLTSYALLVAQIGSLLKRDLAQRLLRAVTGAVLAVLGVRLALQDRR
jgi:RhtB (resistance to homoserine/threonine) family protein